MRFAPILQTDVLFSQNIGRKDRRDTSSAAANTSTTSLLGQKKLKNPDLKFLEAEHLMDSTFDVLASLDKSNKKVAKRVAGRSWVLLRGVKRVLIFSYTRLILAPIRQK